MTWDPPWPPIRIAVDKWIIMRDSRAEPAGVIRRLLFNRQVVFRVVTWAPTSDGRQLVGYFPSLEVADRSIKIRPPTLEARTGPPNGRGSQPAHGGT